MGARAATLLPPARKRAKGEFQKSSVSKPRGKLAKKMTDRLDGARFRWINEQLYTITSGQANDMFKEDPDLFTVYHRGFCSQTQKWPMNPLNRVITYLKALPEFYIVADFGCGEAMLAQSIPNAVHSFDLVAANEHVTACDMAHVPLLESSVDVCVFCLSLMGTNVSDFIREARRVLKKEGILKICEIASRFSTEEEFVQKVERFGFKLISKKHFSKLFIDFEFKAAAQTKNLPVIELKPCIYKRR
jgi:ribosomal RNA-processing protein 8